MGIFALFAQSNFLQATSRPSDLSRPTDLEPCEIESSYHFAILRAHQPGLFDLIEAPLEVLAKKL